MAKRENRNKRFVVWENMAYGREDEKIVVDFIIFVEYRIRLGKEDSEPAQLLCTRLSLYLYSEYNGWNR